MPVSWPWSGGCPLTTCVDSLGRDCANSCHLQSSSRLLSIHFHSYQSLGCAAMSADTKEGSPLCRSPLCGSLQVSGKMDTAHHLVSALSLLQLPSLGGRTLSGQAGELCGSRGCGPTPGIANLGLQCRFPWVVLQLLTSAWQQQQSLAGSLQGAVLKALESITAHQLQEPRQVSWGKLQAF